MKRTKSRQRWLSRLRIWISAKNRTISIHLDTDLYLFNILNEPITDPSIREISLLPRSAESWTFGNHSSSLTRSLRDSCCQQVYPHLIFSRAIIPLLYNTLHKIFHKIDASLTNIQIYIYIYTHIVGSLEKPSANTWKEVNQGGTQRVCLFFRIDS